MRNLCISCIVVSGGSMSMTWCTTDFIIWNYFSCCITISYHIISYYYGMYTHIVLHVRVGFSNNGIRHEVMHSTNIIRVYRDT